MDTEHLHIKLSVEDKSTELFAEFINYVAEKGYIEDNPAVKNLFAYRLTGYYRPEGDLPPIVWNGRNGKSYELIYLSVTSATVATTRKCAVSSKAPNG